MFEEILDINRLTTERVQDGLKLNGYHALRFPQDDVEILCELFHESGIEFPKVKTIKRVETNVMITSETKPHINAFINRRFIEPLENLLFHDVQLDAFGSFSEDDMHWYYHCVKYEKGSFISRHDDGKISFVSCLSANNPADSPLRIYGYKGVKDFLLNPGDTIVINKGVEHEVPPLKAGSRMSLVLRPPNFFPELT